MWRPVALTAFLALLFMSSRSGQPPVETNTNDLAKADFGASASREHTDAAPQIEIDLSQSSAHQKTLSAQESAENTQEEPPETSGPPVAVASAEVTGSRAIPLPEPKADVSRARVLVTQGEQKTALTTGEGALRLMPPGPDFAAKVQRELARLGCYRGRVDNIWGPMSRNAVARFNRVAKGKLPLKQPTRALLSSTRKAPDGYCNGGSEAGSRVASLDPGAGLEDLKNRPSYLPPWMRGEAMPDAEQEAESDSSETPQASPQRSETTRRRAERPKPRRAQRRQVRRQARRQVRRSRSSFETTLRGWPGSGMGR